MACEHFGEAISALADGSLEPAERPRVEAHLEACDDCRALLDDLRALRRSAASLEPASLPPTLWPRVAARLREQGVREPSDSPWPGRSKAATLRPRPSKWRIRCPYSPT